MWKRRFVLFGVLASCIFSACWAILFRPHEVGPRYKGLPTSYWKNAVSDYYTGRKPPTLVGTLESYLGLRNKNGVPSLLDNDPAAVQVLLDMVRSEGVLGLYADLHLHSLGVLSSLSKSDQDDCVNTATGCFFSKDWDVSAFASAFLNKHLRCAGPRTVDRLNVALHDEDAFVRFNAVRLLADIGPEAAPAILSLSELLNDTTCFVVPRNQKGPFRTISEEAAEALRQINPAAAVGTGIK